jgi:hypothetical protein
MPAEKAARQIACAIRRRKHEAVITGHGKMAVWLYRHCPWLVRGVLGMTGIEARPEP